MWPQGAHAVQLPYPFTEEDKQTRTFTGFQVTMIKLLNQSMLMMREENVGEVVENVEESCRSREGEER